MGIDVAPTTVAWILTTFSISIFAYLIGSFVEWNKHNETRNQLKSDLREAYLESDELRYTIQDLIASGRSLNNHASLKQNR
jgi:hypothetical protein